MGRMQHSALVQALLLFTALRSAIFAAGTLAAEPPQSRPQKAVVRAAAVAGFRAVRAQPTRERDWRLLQDVVAFNRAIADNAAAALADTLAASPSRLFGMQASQQTGQWRRDAGYEILMPDGSLLLPAAGLDTLAAVTAGQRSKSAFRAAGQIYLVQFTQSQLAAAQVRRLLQHDISFVESWGNKCAVFRMPVAALAPVQRLPFVRWIGRCPPRTRLVSPEIARRRTLAWIFTFGAPAPEEVQELQSLQVPVHQVHPEPNILVATLGPGNYARVLELDWVKKVAAAPRIGAASLPATFRAGDSRELVCAPYVTGADGSGVTVGFYDTGIRADHAAFGGRVLRGASDGSGHGTHVAGIVAASAVDGAAYRGVAPAANLYMRSFIKTSVVDAFADFQANQIRLVNNSWFFLDASDQPFFTYDANTEMVDGFADDPDSGTGDGDFSAALALIIVAGNSGASGARTITNPGNGKNVLTVGAIDYTIDGVGGLGRRASYSSIGPTRQGRLKPELVAPGGAAGKNDASAQRAQYGVVSANGFGALDEPELYWPQNDQYVRLKGTSMAAPHVTGAAALAVDFWQRRGWDWNFLDLKAHLVNHAIPLQANTGDPAAGYATVRAGYGLLNALSTIAEKPDESETLFWAKGFLVENANTRDEWTFAVPQGALALSATLAYSDEPGAALLHDLDLELMAPGGAAFAHVLPAEVAAESPVEKIVVPGPAAGEWTARVNYSAWPEKPLLISSQQYTVVASVRKKQPQLRIDALPLVSVSPQDTVEIICTVRNAGGYIAAGVTVQVEDVYRTFTGEINRRKLAGNLISGAAARAVRFSLRAPAAPGDYALTLKADAINRALQPATQEVLVQVLPDTAGGSFRLSNLRPLNYQTAELQNGDRYYVDRLWTIQRIPSEFENMLWIKTAQNDYQHTNLNFSFDVNRSGSIYVAYDPTLAPPQWLGAAYSRTGFEIEVENSSGGRLALWARRFTPGTITLGDNQGVYPAAMYVVLLRPDASESLPPTAVLSLPPALTAASGDHLEVPVLLSSIHPIKSMRFSLLFDRSSMKFAGARPGRDATGFAVTEKAAGLPPPPGYGSGFERVAIQLESDTAAVTGAQREIAQISFEVQTIEAEETSLLAFDSDTAATVLQTDGDVAVQIPHLTLENASLRLLPRVLALSGTVHYALNQAPVPDARILLLSNAGYAQEATTGSSGAYVFSQLSAGAYTLHPSKIGGINEAISLTDGIWVLQYLSFSRPFSDDQLRAADVVRDDQVDGSDALAILLYLMGQSTASHAGLWQFSPAAAEMALDSSRTRDFAAYLLGDVNGDWRAGAASRKIGTALAVAEPARPGAGAIPQATTGAAASGADLQVHLQHFALMPGDTFSVPVRFETGAPVDVTGLLAQVRIDTASFSFLGLSRTALANRFLLATYAPSLECLRIGMISARGAPADSAVFALPFRVRPGSRTHTASIDFERLVVNARSLPPAVVAVVQIGRPRGEEMLPDVFQLLPNFPNPFNAGTRIAYYIPLQTPLPLPVTLRIYDTRGRLVSRFERHISRAGLHTLDWDGRDLRGHRVASGVYFCAIEAGAFRAVRKMAVVQ